MVYVAFIGGGNTQLFTRQFDQVRSVAFDGTEGAMDPFFSPDGQWIGFTSADNKLKKMRVTGGGVSTLCEIKTPHGGASWGEDDYIIAGIDRGNPILVRIPASGGTPQPVTKLESDEQLHRDPQVLNGGRAVMYSAGFGPYREDIVVRALPDGPRKTIYKDAFSSRYLASGHILFVKDGTAYAMPFDASRLEVTGVPVPVLENLAYLGQAAELAVARDGTILTREQAPASRQSLGWLEREGTVTPLGLPPARYRAFVVSPDGRRVAVTIANAGRYSIWIYDIQLGSMTLVVKESTPIVVWSPDSKYLAYPMQTELRWIRADGVDADRPHSVIKQNLVPFSSTPDGQTLAVRNERFQLFTLGLQGDANRPTAAKAEPFLASRGLIVNAQFSPDGKWLAYSQSEATNLAPELFVTPFPSKSGRWQISNGGGYNPQWARNGNQLFFESRDGTLMVARYQSQGETFRPIKPEIWRVWQREQLPGFRVSGNTSLAPDGQRFLVASVVDESKPDTTVLVLRNFFDEVRRIVAQGVRQ